MFCQFAGQSRPAGSWSSDQQRELLAFCAASAGVYLVSDEVYVRLIYDRPRAPSFLDIAEHLRTA